MNIFKGGRDPPKRDWKKGNSEGIGKITLTNFEGTNEC